MKPINKGEASDTILIDLFTSSQKSRKQKGKIRAKPAVNAA